MDQNGFQGSPPFDAEELARLEKAARLVGKTPEAFVRDAALAAAADPFLKALSDAGDRARRLAQVFDTQDTHATGEDRTAWPDPAPMTSRDLHDVQHHGHVA
ncbi:hypothetical protein [Streptomyces tauricus]